MYRCFLVVSIPCLSNHRACDRCCGWRTSLPRRRCQIWRRYCCATRRAACATFARCWLLWHLAWRHAPTQACQSQGTGMHITFHFLQMISIAWLMRTAATERPELNGSGSHSDLLLSQYAPQEITACRSMLLCVCCYATTLYTSMLSENVCGQRCTALADAAAHAASGGHLQLSQGSCCKSWGVYQVQGKRDIS